MIELKQVYAGRAQHVYPIPDLRTWGPGPAPLHETLHWDYQTLPDDLIQAALRAWHVRPFTATRPLQLQVAGSTPNESYDVFLWLYARDGEVFPSLQAALQPNPPGWKL